MTSIAASSPQPSAKMKLTRCSHDAFAAAIAVLLLYINFAGIVSVQAADPDPLMDVDPSANNTGFVFRNVYANGATTTTDGGTRAALNTTIFPALKMEGITYVHFRMKPCGENEPHTHPRATELLTMVSGGPIQAGVVDTTGAAHIYILYPGDIIVFPRGLLHYELNVGSEEAFFISALNSQNPGVLTAATALLKLPTRAVAGAVNQNFNTATKLKEQSLPYSTALIELKKNAGCVPGKDITTEF